MIDTDFKVGAILVNSMRQYTKVISFKRGVYGLSGWTTRDNAEKATIAHIHVNVHGLTYANARVATSDAKKANAKAPAKPSTPTGAASKSDSNKRQAAPKKAATKKTTAKKSAKTTSKKSGKSK